MKFNKTTKPVAKTVNRAGAVAFRMGAEQELAHAVLTTFLEDKFYESGNARLTRIQTLVAECKPQYVANLAVIARLEFNLRSVSHVLLGELSKVHFGDSLVMNAIVAAATRPDDCLEIASYVGKPMSKQVKRGIRNAILKYSPYQIAKYRGEGKEMSMVDLFNLVHPKVQHATKEQKKSWKDLMEGNLVSFDTWETESSNSSIESRTEVWEKLVLDNKLGYMALLRNLNNLIKYKVSEQTQDMVIDKLTDRAEVLKSKQLPFRFLTAYQNVAGNRKFTDAISQAMDIALENTPEFSGKTLIAIDSSGSMTSGANSAIQKASIFGATLLKANKNSDVILYDTRVKELGVSSRLPVVDLADHIIRACQGGGTDTSLVFSYAYTKKIVYDRIIIISDNESWVHNAQFAYTQYKNKMGCDPFVYAIDIQGYGTKDLSGGKVMNLTGWSDRLLDFIAYAERGDNLIDYIRDYKIPKIVRDIPKKNNSKKVIKRKK